jgi:hypothetical protein
VDDQLLTLSKIFTERLFRIPDYQRGYAWTEKQLKDFWTDIQQLEPEHNHYTGVLTLEGVPKNIYKRWDDDYWIIKSKNYQPFYIVDGQQRLTTAIILIQVIIEKIMVGKKLNYTEKIEIQRRFIYESKDDGISRSYIFGYEKDNPSYEFLKTKIFCEQSSTNNSQETVYTHNLIRAKDFFSKCIENFSHEELEKLYSKITQHLLFNIFTITEDVDVCVAFETMNNRGKPLSYLELLKNRLIYLSLKFNKPNYERDKLRRAINDCWKSIYHNLGRNKDRPLDDDRFLLCHYIVYYGKALIDENQFDEPTRYRRLYRADYVSDLLEKRFITKNVIANTNSTQPLCIDDIYTYVSSLQQAVEMWYKIHNPLSSGFPLETQIWLDKLNRIGLENIQPLLLAFLLRISDKNKQVQFFQILERYLFTLSLLNNLYYRSYPMHIDITNPKILQLSVELNNDKITGDKVISILNEQINEINQEKNYIKSITERFNSKGFYDWSGIRYFLFEYNLHLQEQSKTERPKIFWPEFSEVPSDFISVEHIYPQQPKDTYWKEKFKGYNKKQKNSLQNSLGNLLPLSKPKNSSLSNKPFPDKKGRPNSTGGYQFGCYAENEVAIVNDWTPEQILDRGIKMLNFMEKRWKIIFVDISHKKHFLGLDFMK